MKKSGKSGESCKSGFRPNFKRTMAMKHTIKYLLILIPILCANLSWAASYIDYQIRTDDFYANVAGGESGDEEIAWKLKYKFSSATYSSELCYTDSDDYESGAWWSCSTNTIWTGRILDNADDLYIYLYGWENDDEPNCSYNGGDDDYSLYTNIDTNISGNPRNAWTGFYGSCASGTCSGYVRTGASSDINYRVEIDIWWNYVPPVNPSFSITGVDSNSFSINKTNNNNYRITDWDYQVSTNTAFSAVVKSGTEITASSTTVTGLSPNTTYYIRIRGENEAGTGSYTSYKTQTTPKADQTISFSALPAKAFGDADFAPGATASSGLLVSYASSNTSVATIVSGQIHIVEAGTSNITASQAGNSAYNAAPSVVRQLTVNARPGLWIGEVSGSWQEGGNWHDGNVPDDADDVVIPDAITTSNDPDVNAAYTVNSFTVEDGGVVNFTDSGSQIIADSGEISVNGTGESGNGAFVASGSNKIQLRAQSDDITLAGSKLSAENGDIVLESTSGTINLTGSVAIDTIASTTTISGATGGGGTLNVSAGTLVYQRDGDQAIFSGACPDLNISGSGIKTLGGALALSGNLNIGSGLTMSIAASQTLTVQGDMTNAGILECAAGSEVIFSGSDTSTLSGAGTWNFKTLTLNKGASDDKLDINTGSDVTVDTALTVTTGTVDLSGWDHNLKIGGAMSIGTNGRWIKHPSTTNFIQFYGNACTLGDTSSPGPQNLGHVKVEDLP